MPIARRIDARAWLVWVAGMLVLVMVARNPLYTLLLMLVAWWVMEVWRQNGRFPQLPFVRLGVFMLLLAALLNSLLAHTGETVLFRLPQAWPWVGGNITLEAAIMGAANGLVLFTLLLTFQGFNQAVSPGEIVRLIPGTWRDMGVVLLIAITYIPETTRQLRQIREAQAIRGHQLRGWRDWRPVVLPLLVAGLERAMGLAEAMVARGYGATADAGLSVWMQVGLLVSLTAVFGGWALTLWAATAGWLLIALGMVGLWWLSRKRGRRVLYTRYHAGWWGWPEFFVVITAVLPVLIILLPIWPVDYTTLSYTPPPQFALPAFDPWLGLSLLGMATPAWLPFILRQRQTNDSH